MDLTSRLFDPLSRDLDPDLNKGIERLRAQGNRIQDSFQFAIETKGGQLLGLITFLINAQFPDSNKLERLTEGLTEEITFMQSTKADTFSMQASTHVQIEACRGRKKHKETDLSNAKASIESLQGQITDCNKTISTYESDISDLNKTAGELEDRGNNIRRAAKKKTGRGIWGAVAGVVLAPFTGGASLVVGGAFAGINLSNADDCFKKVKELRNDAASKRKNADALKLKLQALIKGKDRKQKDVTDLERETGKLEAACVALNNTTACLRSSLEVMDRVINYLGDVELSIKEAKMHGQTFQAVFCNREQSLVGRTDKYVTDLKTKWKRLEDILLQNGAKPIEQ